MPDWSRRRLLRAASPVALAAVAGCSGEESASHSDPPRIGELVTGYEVERVRNADGRPLFRIGEKTSESGEAAAREERRTAPYTHVTAEEDLAEVSFTETDEASTLQRFVRDTDLTSRSVFLHTRPVGECYRARIESVRRKSDAVFVDFCRDLRPADVACRADATDTVGYAIRLPFPGDSLSGSGLGWGSSCHGRPRGIDLTSPSSGNRS